MKINNSNHLNTGGFFVSKGVVIIALFFVSCNGGDKTFCECVEVGDALSNKTQEFFNRAPNEQENKEIQELKKKKNELCKPYQEMGGDQLRTLQKDCSTVD